jgi:hypothetical protein
MIRPLRWLLGVRMFVKPDRLHGINPMDHDLNPMEEDGEISRKINVSSSIIMSWWDDNLKHNIEDGGVMYKYDLPLENKAIEFKHLL